MFGFIGTIFIYLFLFIFYIIKFLGYLILILLLLLWKHQGAILYQRHAPSRKRQLAYNPFPRVRTPSYYKFDFDDFFVTTKDKVLIHCWLIRQANSTECPTLICFHGNAGNIGYRLPNAYYMFRELHCNIIMVDYRGYGNSEGVPTEKGLSYDAESILAHLLERNDINLNKVFLFGRSLGGAVAIDLAWRCCMGTLMTLDNEKILINDQKVDTNDMNAGTNDSTMNSSTNALNPSDDELTRLNNTHSDEDKKIMIAGLIIENTFTSILDMVFVIIDEFLKSRSSNHNANDVEMDNDHVGGIDFNAPTKTARLLRYLRIFLKYFITNNWNSASKVNEIVLPSLYLSGLNDELVPPKQMKQLFHVAKQSSVLPVMQTFKEGDHNSTWQRAGQQYWDDIVAFLTTTSSMADRRLSM
eukprot:225781_1